MITTENYNTQMTLLPVLEGNEMEKKTIKGNYPQRSNLTTTVKSKQFLI
ncbi:hypothetical protein AAHH67_17360 [Niallia circulans]